MKDQKSPISAWQNIIFICLIFLLLLLIGNITFIVIALSLNRHICADAAQAAAAVYDAGGNLLEVKSAVIRAINEPVINVFFIRRPEVKELRFYVKTHAGQKQQMLLVKTVTGVRIPAPFLLFISGPQQVDERFSNGFLYLDSSYAIKLKEILHT